MARQLTPEEQSCGVLPGQAFVPTTHGDIPVSHSGTDEPMVRPIGSSTYYDTDRDSRYMDHRSLPLVPPPSPFATRGGR